MLTSACKVDFTILATLAFTEAQDRVRRYDLPDEPSCFWNQPKIENLQAFEEKHGLLACP
jgi:hypothetical protein